MEEDEIITNPYESFVSDPNVESDLDRSGIRTTTQTDEQLLANVPDAVGLRFDPTNYNYTKDLYNYYGGGLPMVDTAPVTNAPITNVADTSSGTDSQITGSQDQAASGLGTDTSMYGGDLDQGGAGDGITNYEYTPEETTEQQQAIDQSIQDLKDSGLYNLDYTPEDPTIANARLNSSFYVPNETNIPPEQPGMLDNISTAAKDAFETVKSGASTALDFIKDYGYPAYQALQGNLVAAGLSVLNPLTLGLGFAGKIFEGLGDTKSQEEYDSYSDEQKAEIDKAYGPGGIMQGYNAVSGFGQGVSGTVQDRIDTIEETIASGNRVATPEQLADPNFNSLEKQLDKLYGLQDKAGLTKRPTQEQIYDRDDVDPADEGFTVTGNVGGNDFYSAKGTTVNSVTGEMTDKNGNYAGNVYSEAAQDFGTTPTADPYEDIDSFYEGDDVGIAGAPGSAMDAAFGPGKNLSNTPTPDPAIANAALNSSFYVDDSSSDTDTSSPSPANEEAAIADAALSGSFYTPSPSPAPSSGGGSSGGSSKIVCTMMNGTYGFGSFRNKIWMKFHKDIAPEYQKGYHKLFLPLVKIAKTNKIVKKVLEHIAVHSTIDMRQATRGKTHLLGRVYRKIIKPICYLVGKYVK